MSGGNDSQQPEHAYRLGDLVEDVDSGGTWNVEDYYPGGSCHPAMVVLGRDTLRGVAVTDRSPEQIRLVTPAAERSIYPGDGWSDHVFLRQAGQTVEEFASALTRRFADPAASQPAAAEPEAGPGDPEPGA